MVSTWLIKGVFYKCLFIIYKNEWECLFNRDVILNRAKDYYENDKERLREQARDKCRNLQKKKKIKRENMEKKKTKYVWRKKAKIKKIIVRLKNLSI